MPRRLTSRSSAETLKREAKRWLRALRANDPAARARLHRVIPDSTAEPALRTVQHALAREYGFAGWADLLGELARRAGEDVPATREGAVQALLSAAGRGDARHVAAVLDAFPDIVSERALLSGHDGRRTALHHAMGGGHEDVVDVLLAHGAHPNIRDDGDNAMPLHFAAERGNLAIVRKLIEHGADPNGAGDTHELSVIGWATCFGYAFHRDVAEYLLAHGAHHTIFSAVAMGDTSAIREIIARSRTELDRRMDQTNRRRRPLHLAVIRDRADSLATLLELGAGTEATDEAGLTALDQAAFIGEAHLARQLIDAGARIHLPAAVALGRSDDIERLLREDPDCLRPGGRWARLIIRAAEKSTGAVVETLIRTGASVHVRDDHRTAVDQTHGFTALHAAAFNGNTDAVRVLLRYGADPTVREDRYWGTPAGWADYAGHTAIRDIILEGPIDLFEAVLFDRLERIDEILARDPQALERKIGEYVTGKDTSKPWLDSGWTPLAWAAANGRPAAVHALLERGANPDVRDSQGRTPGDVASTDAVVEVLQKHAPAAMGPSVAVDFDGRVADFLLLACSDWRTAGSFRQIQAHDALRLLDREPAIARANIFTAVVAGEMDAVRRMLDEHPESVSQIGGPRRWPPILYLCAARLPSARANEGAVDVLRLLLERDADPNAFYLGGNADIHYTALTCVLGRGEELAPMHARARELTELLLTHGADPHDNQVLYNVFADNTSRHLLDDDIVWLLELMYQHSLRRGHAADWADPDWPMFDMRGAPSLGDEGRVHRGARFMLDAAVERNLTGLAEWLLEHGASPNSRPGELWRGRPKRTLHQEALARGHTTIAGLLARYGAEQEPLRREGVDALVDACLALDRDRAREILASHPEYLQHHRPMFTLIERDRADAVALLLDSGVSQDVEDAASGHVRALHMAAAVNSRDCAKLLIARGAEIDPRESRHDATPIGWASWFGHTPMIDLLSEYSRDAWTLVWRGRVDRLRDVLAESPELARDVNGDGQSLLFWLPADEDTALAVVQLFLEHDADPTQRDRRGRTAADVAERRGMDRVAALLRSTPRAKHD
jgi:uncharacterized protein